MSATGLDRKTVRAFLDGETWPHRPTRIKIGEALDLADDAIDNTATGRAAPDAAPAPLDEATVMLWLKARLPGRLGNHIVSQYEILRDAADAEARTAHPPGFPVGGGIEAQGAHPSVHDTASPRPDSEASERAEERRRKTRRTTDSEGELTS